MNNNRYRNYCHYRKNQRRYNAESTIVSLVIASAFLSNVIIPLLKFIAIILIAYFVGILLIALIKITVKIYSKHT